MKSRTRWEQIKYDSIVMALEANGGVKSRAANWLGISIRTMTDYFKKNPELRDCLCRKSRQVSNVNLSIEYKNRVRKTMDNSDDCHELRPIGWVPSWYREKYPWIFEDE